MLLRVVLAIEDRTLRRDVQGILADMDAMVETVRGRRHLWERAAHRSADVIIASRSVIGPSMEDGIGLARELPESPTIVLLTDSDDAEEHAELLAAGCDTILQTGIATESLADALRAILDKHHELMQEKATDRRPLAQPQLLDFVSESPAMTAFMAVVRRIVDSQTSLLILGETGVGKERLARAIHAEGPRADGPFVAVSCAALPESLLESELFGHEEGAFTGATRARRGAFELAHGGTIFLDEIADMHSHLQVKLLRAVQEREIQRIGGEKPFEVDVRVMAATNCDLQREVRDRRFRQDLFYRLSVVSLTIPPLRERREDIPILAKSYLEYLSPRIGRTIRRISDKALECLCGYHWPGNVRELINVIERAMLLASGGTIHPGDLPMAVRCTERASGQTPYWALLDDADPAPAEWLRRPLKDVRNEILQRVERSYLSAMLRSTGGRVGRTAELAGIQPRTLYDKMKAYGLHKEDFRRSGRSAKPGEL